MPRKLRRYKRRPLRPKPAWQPTEEQRRELRPLLADVDADAGEGDPAFLALLAYWRGCEPPWDAFPLAHIYRCKDSTWITDGVEGALSAIQTHVEDSGAEERPLA
jgi:hypothetical protein